MCLFQALYLEKHKCLRDSKLPVEHACNNLRPGGCLLNARQRMLGVGLNRGEACGLRLHVRQHVKSKRAL